MLKLNQYNIVVLTEADFETQIVYNEYCRKHKIFFISCDVRGVWSYIFNDFGESFEVTDKDGVDPVEYFIQNITNEEQALVTLIDKT